MKLYDDLIAETEKAVYACKTTRYDLDSVTPWKDAGENVLLLAKESAYELGAGGSGFCACLVTRDAAAVRKNEIVVCGEDLGALKGDAPYARIAVALTEGIDDEADPDAAYKSVRGIDFVKYHVFPEGYMLRISSEGSREQVRVGRRAVRDGISFSSVGALYAGRYLAHPNVRAVKLIFVTDKNAVAALKRVAEESRRRTAALNKILQNVMLDCSVCSLKPVCDEVEELKALHFGRSAKAQGENK